MMNDNSNRQLARPGESVLAGVEMDPRILMAAKAIQIMSGKNDDGSPKIGDEMAIAAALYQAGTGQLVGRDFYVNDRVGRMEGYRGAARDAADRGAGEMQIEYRQMTNDEIAENEIQPGDSTYVCEVYQLRAWKLAQSIGKPYKPIVGIGIIREIEKYDKKSTQGWNAATRHYDSLPRQQWRLLTLEGGMTWAKKARNRAYKDALRHVPGVPASVDEVLEEGTLQGVELPAEGARLDMERARAWVESQRNADAVQGEFRKLTPEEQGATLRRNTAAMRGPKVDDPLGIDEPPGADRGHDTPSDDHGASESFDQLTTAREEQAQESGDALITPAQIKLLHVLVNKLYPDAESRNKLYIPWLKGNWRVESSKDLTSEQASQAIDMLTKLAER